MSMHNLQDPEDAAVTSDPFGYNKVNEGEQHEKRISVKWLSVCQWQWYTMIMLFVCVFEVSVVYRYVVNFERLQMLCDLLPIFVYSCW